MNHNHTNLAELLINTYATLHNLYHTAQPVPHCTTTATTNHCSLSNHYSSTNHCPLYHNTHQPVQSTCTNQFVSQINQLSQSESAHQTQSPWVKPTAHTTHPIWVKPTAHKATCANLSQLYQDACVPVPNQSYICVNLIKCFDSQPTLLTWPSSSSKRHIWATKRLHILSTKLFPNTLNSMTP